MRSFKEAEQYGKLAVDSLTVAQAEYWMGKMLYDEGRKEEALNLIISSETLIGNHYAERAIIENSKAVIYLLMGQHECVELRLRKSLAHDEKEHSDKVKNKILNNYSVLYRLQGKYDQAIQCLKQNEFNLVFDGKELLLLYLNLGIVYFGMGEMDSANYYYNKIEAFMPTAKAKLETQLAAYDALYKFSSSINEDSLALLYKEKHEDILFDIMQHRQEQNTYRIQQQYDYESLQNKMIQERSRMQRLVAIGIVLLLCIVALFFYQSSQRNKKEAETNANLFHFMQQNKALVESNMAHEKKAIDTMQQLSDVLFARLKAMQKLDYSLKNPKDKIALKDLEKEVFGDGEHWEAVKEVLDALYPGLWESLKLKYPEMDEMERRVFMMSRLKLSRLGEATLLGISTSVLDKLRTKVHRIVEEEKI
jgi:tetratricopeptide (TPR) repeat protein